MIGRTKYSLLEEAIEAANNTQGSSDRQVRIDIVTNISKRQKIIIDNTKNIKLDLNGYSITTEAVDYLFENQGILEIIDSNTEIIPEEGEDIPLGKIYSTTSDTILNSGNGKIILTSGTIQNSVNGKYVIINKNSSELTINNTAVINGVNGVKNENDAKITMNNGTINASSGYAIYTEGSSQILINNGEIKADTGTTIYNNGTAEIIIKGGTIETTGSYYYNGIDNRKTGKIIIKGGTFNFNNRSYAIDSEKGELNIENGTFNITGTFIWNSDNSKTNITGGTVNLSRKNYV